MAVHFYSHASRIVHHKSFRLPLVVFYVLPIFWFNLLFLACFVKSFLKGNVLQSESERGVNSILISILRFWPSSWKDRTFCLVAYFSASREDHFQKKCPKRTFLSDFVKFGSEILYFGRKNGRLLFCFVATLSDFGLLFLKLKHSSSCSERCL